MASNDEEETSEFQEEVSVLQEIYINELEVLNDENGGISSISLQLHPATGDQVDLKWVCLTLVLTPPPGYPDEVPQILIRNPRGLAEEHVTGLQHNLEELAEERRGQCMLFELIELAKESLTQDNIPHGECVICKEGFSEAENFTKTQCYHYFHCHCLFRYIEHSESDLKAEYQAALKTSPHMNIERKLVVCPVCRDPVSYDLTQLSSYPAPDDLDPSAISLSPQVLFRQQQMAALFQRQKDHGGIIDIEAERNKFLVTSESSSTLSTLDDASNRLEEQTQPETVERNTTAVTINQLPSHATYNSNSCDKFAENQKSMARDDDSVNNMRVSEAGRGSRLKKPISGGNSAAKQSRNNDMYHDKYRDHRPRGVDDEKQREHSQVDSRYVSRRNHHREINSRDRNRRDDRGHGYHDRGRYYKKCDSDKAACVADVQNDNRVKDNEDMQSPLVDEHNTISKVDYSQQDMDRETVSRDGHMDHKKNQRYREQNVRRNYQDKRGYRDNMGYNGDKGYHGHKDYVCDKDTEFDRSYTSDRGYYHDKHHRGYNKLRGAMQRDSVCDNKEDWHADFQDDKISINNRDKRPDPLHRESVDTEQVKHEYDDSHQESRTSTRDGRHITDSRRGSGNDRSFYSAHKRDGFKSKQATNYQRDGNKHQRDENKHQMDENKHQRDENKHQRDENKHQRDENKHQRGGNESHENGSTAPKGKNVTISNEYVLDNKYMDPSRTERYEHVPDTRKSQRDRRVFREYHRSDSHTTDKSDHPGGRRSRYPVYSSTGEDVASNTKCDKMENHSGKTDGSDMHERVEKSVQSDVCHRVERTDRSSGHHNWDESTKDLNDASGRGSGRGSTKGQSRGRGRGRGRPHNRSERFDASKWSGRYDPNHHQEKSKKDTESDSVHTERSSTIVKPEAAPNTDKLSPSKKPHNDAIALNHHSHSSREHQYQSRKIDFRDSSRTDHSNHRYSDHHHSNSHHGQRHYYGSHSHGDKQSRSEDAVS